MDTLLSLAGLAATAPAAARRPLLTLSFAPAGGAAGGIGAALGGLGEVAGALAAAGSVLGVGLVVGQDPWQRSVTAVVVESGLAPFVDVAHVTLAADTQSPAVTVGDEGTVAMGYEDTPPSPVFTGAVHSVRRSLEGATRFSVTNGGVTLSRLRLMQSYERQSAGAIINDVVARASVPTDTIETGIDFPFFVVDDRQGAYAHLAAIARRCGCAASFTPDGKLRVAPIGGGDPVQTFNYGADILALTLTDAAPTIKSVTSRGDGAAGSHGQDAWSWLIKDPSSVTGTSGNGDPARTFPDPTLRSQDAARAAAAGIATAASYQTLAGDVLTPGAPAVVPGAVIAIAGAPHDTMNGQFLVQRVRHRFAKRTGFTTHIAFSKLGGQGGGFDPLSALGGLL
jgi:hypothetical protein